MSSSQTSSTTSGSLPSSTGANIAPSATGAKTVRQSSYAQSYLTAANANQSNSNPVMRSAVTRSVVGPPSYANVTVSAEPPAKASNRGRMQPSGTYLINNNNNNNNNNNLSLLCVWKPLWLNG